MKKRIIEKKWIVATFIVISLLAVIGAIGLYQGRIKGNLQEGLKVEKDTVDWDTSLATKNQLKEESIKIPYYEELTMQTDSPDVKVKLVNPKENSCYFTYTWRIEGEDKVLYTSNLIEPGKAINTVTLNEKLQQGTYPLCLQIDTYSLEDKTELNKAVVKTTLVVQ